MKAYSYWAKAWLNMAGGPALQDQRDGSVQIKYPNAIKACSKTVANMCRWWLNLGTCPCSTNCFLHSHNCLTMRLRFLPLDSLCRWSIILFNLQVILKEISQYVPCFQVMLIVVNCCNEDWKEMFECFLGVAFIPALHKISHITGENLSKPPGMFLVVELVIQTSQHCRWQRKVYYAVAGTWICDILAITAQPTWYWHDPVAAIVWWTAWAVMSWTHDVIY